MSPSTYIEQEQEASIRRELPKHEFKNIERMTYQTAMHRAQKGNLDIHADTVIFDEFHHTGAPQWSRGVEGVIECNPDANLIGLSATSIRYSDSGRDMSDELFDGHIASYMSLTDCWVLGILPVPTYVTAGYSINGYIEDLSERIAKEESAGRRAELLADFNELRDCASRAANLPAIFQKYFEGIEKVIVFCPNVFELNEIEKMCPRWFSRVNGNVHTYVVHSSNPSGRVNTMGSKRTMMRPQSSFCFASTSLTRGFTSRAWMPSLWYVVPRRRRFLSAAWACIDRRRQLRTVGYRSGR